jgi:hypothetical protein
MKDQMQRSRKARRARAHTRKLEIVRDHKTKKQLGGITGKGFMRNRWDLIEMHVKKRPVTNLSQVLNEVCGLQPGCHTLGHNAR